MLARLSLSCALVARSKIERSAPLGMMRCEISFVVRCDSTSSFGAADTNTPIRRKISLKDAIS
jgi:hypothetical protein